MYIYLKKYKTYRKDTTMSIKADFHLHSNFSGDSYTPMKDMIESAITRGLTHMCITEHYDPDYVYIPGEEGMFELNIDSYLYEVLKLRNLYKNKINIGFGVELGLQPHLKRELAVFAKSKDFDFIIGSSHICNRKDPYYPTFFEGRTEDEAHQEYFESVYNCIKTCPYFDVYGHIDYVVRYGPTKGDNYTYAKHSDVLDRILRLLIYNEKGIELNTGGFRSGLDQPNPCYEIIKRYRELGGEIITIGSDAHNTKDIAGNFDRAEEILKACGFKYYSIFQNRMPEFKKL